VEDDHTGVRPNLGAGGPSFLISLAGQPCGVPRPCVLCWGGRRCCLRLCRLSCRGLHRTYGAHPLHDHLSKRGLEESGTKATPAVSSTLHNATAGRFPKKRNAPPHFLAFLLSRFPAFLRDFAQPIADSKSLLLAP
jgi:hypothetical protein